MDFNHAADVIYGTICCLCFLLGTVGNIVSFLYFKAKKKDISSVIYILITANDLVVSVIILPVGISFLSERSPGIVFGTSLGCIAWAYLRGIAVSYSIFLVLCLSITRTVSLIRPFQQQKIRHLLIAIVSYFLLILALSIGLHVQKSIEVRFSPSFLRCDFFLKPDFLKTNRHIPIILLTVLNSVYMASAFVVVISCVISTVLLTRRNNISQQRELQLSRNKATVTILLFALVYGVCNVPLVVDYIFQTYATHTDNVEWYYNLYQFDTQLYYRNAIFTVLIAANSAANPILYFWRMPRLKEFARGIMRLSEAGAGAGAAACADTTVNREPGRPSNNQREPAAACADITVNRETGRPSNNQREPAAACADITVNRETGRPSNNQREPVHTIIENCNITQDLPPAEAIESSF